MADRQALRTHALLAIVIIVAPILGAVASTLNRSEPPAAEAAAENGIRDRVLRPTATPTDVPDAAASSSAAPAGSPPTEGGQPPAAAPPDAPESGDEDGDGASPADPAEATPPQDAGGEAPATEAPPPSVLPDSQLVVFYGLPEHDGLGILGWFPPEETARRVRDQAAAFDVINGDRPAVGALDIIYGLVQAEPTANGLYLRYLEDSTVEQWIALAEQQDVQLILDLQIGRASIVDEVRHIERFLEHPRVHVAIDPEYAVGPNGIPIATPGRISGHEINEVQGFLDELVARKNLPRKMLIIHQYMDETVLEGEVTQTFDNVDLVLNMDAFGALNEKRTKYESYARRHYAEHASYNVFLMLDERVASEREILELSPQPDVIFYQ